MSIAQEVSTPVVVETKKAGFITRARRRAGLVLVTAGLIAAGGVEGAFATVPSTDPTGGAGDSFFTSLTGYLQTHLITAVLALAVIGISVSMLLAWGKRAAKSK